MKTLSTYLIEKFLDLPVKLVTFINEVIRFLIDLWSYQQMAGAEPFRLKDLSPRLFERGSNTSVEPHYFYLSIWAAQRIMGSKCKQHVDVGSLVQLVGFLTCITKVIFIDIRPLAVTLNNLECRKGSILELPFMDGSVHSLSCLHVAEHIGLGRYGDPLDPKGTLRAVEELKRVLAPGGFCILGYQLVTHGFASTLTVSIPRVKFLISSMAWNC